MKQPPVPFPYDKEEFNTLSKFQGEDIPEWTWEQYIKFIDDINKFQLEEYNASMNK